MILQEQQSEAAKGIAAANRGETLLALVHLEKVAAQHLSPSAASTLGYCLAKERRQMQKAVQLCTEAMRREPNNALHHFNLGRVYLLAGQKEKAIKTFRRGLKRGRNPRIVAALKQLGLRDEPIVHFLDREHPLNKYLGLVCKKLGLR
ncbi:MAG: hypothetical protein C0617_05965 [Desulfuromonas sp.]|uniref:tetratricopeptide repeat protein n=1 Tax=Desulfuromonas sp. TaxID=892 RepID=UPI000CB54B78|nr:tetratricopeptide repeat protein [Desulfuromonas sp.]PLX84894.1 MAG: hypothetical protein C0617_05965 [Desulfuromonas sp.]